MAVLSTVTFPGNSLTTRPALTKAFCFTSKAVAPAAAVVPASNLVATATTLLNVEVP